MDNSGVNDWKSAVALMGEWERGRYHLDDLLDRMEPWRSRWLVMEVFRNWMRIDRILDPFMKKTPRPRTLNLMRLATAEMLCTGREKHPSIVHHAVETGKVLGLSRAECGFVNGVLRAVLRQSGALCGADPADTHPAWLVSRWIRQFGKPGVEKLLEWNQSVPRLTVCADTLPGYATRTRWDGYYAIESGRFPEALDDLANGRAYMQDPFAGIPVGMLAAAPGETILDLCAAPGGKTRLLAHAMGGTGTLVAVDKPGRRFERLRENVRRLQHGNIRLVGCRVENLETEQLGQLSGGKPADGALIDVPCSNTGVIQKRPDVKIRLTGDQIRLHAEQQRLLLQHASGLVRPGGRLVYSTCSIEPEENTGVIEAFLSENHGWELGQSAMSYPWECEHDGGGAFLLTRSGRK